MNVAATPPGASPGQKRERLRLSPEALDWGHHAQTDHELAHPPCRSIRFGTLLQKIVVEPD
jgi:hypothetical protein